MVNTSLSAFKHFACVLAAVSITFPDSAGAEFRAFDWHLGVSRQHNHRWDPDWAMHGINRSIALPDWQSEPFRPVHWTNHFLALDFEGGSSPVHHLAERMRRSAHVDRLPVAVQDENGLFVEYIAHRLSWIKWLIPSLNP